MQSNTAEIAAEIPGLYRIIPLKVLRRTRGVTFDNIPLDALPKISAIDRVIHASSASSPGPVAEVTRPWYMHPHQDDNLVVLHGARLVELYRKGYGQVEEFEVTADRIVRNGKAVYEGPAMLAWPTEVFHRVESREAGSSAINFAVHHEGFDIKTNFNIYDLDPATGIFRVIREGFRDQ